MTRTDGSCLKIIREVAAGDFRTFGMSLLQDENGDQVEILENNYRNKGDEAVTQAIIRKWLKSGGPTCTYQHLIECLDKAELGSLAGHVRNCIKPQ